MHAGIRAILVTAAALLSACDGNPPSSPEALPDNPFQRQMETPVWLHDIEAPRVSTADEVSALWQSKKRCCVSTSRLAANNREFYKACYNAIGEHFDDHELVVKCLWLMPAGAERDQRRQISRYLVEHHFWHDSRTDNCSNCAPADTVARVSLRLAGLEQQAGRIAQANQLLERVLDERLDEISPWVQVEIYTSLAWGYLQGQVTDIDKERLHTAYRRLGALAEHDGTVARRMAGFERKYRVASER